ncbi:MAG: rhomboid family intramembrane serine protease [Bacillota bacterium]|nr:rhomboid family intramembrane serine protease [Bacillota bacterium]
MFYRHENFKQFTNFYPIISSIIAINAVLFILSLFPSIYQPIYLLGIGSNQLVASGEIWRLVTSIFLHGNFTHFLFNNFSLFIFGPALEKMLGFRNFLILFLGAGVIGNIGTFFAGGIDYGRHLGASGAIYGLLGIYLYMILYRKELIDPDSSRIIKYMLIIGLVYSVITPNINLWAHLFGLLGGLAAGYLFLKSSTRNYRFKGKKNSGFKEFKHLISPKRNNREAEKSKIIQFDPNRRQQPKDNSETK